MKTKNLRLSLITMVISFSMILISDVFSQSPYLMSYQTVIRNTAGELVANHYVGIKLSVLQGSPGGTVVYSEVITKSTNANGLLSLELGSGTVLVGNFMLIDWTAGPYFLQTDIDPEGGMVYTITSVSQFLSVPYSMFADKAGSVAGTAGGDLGGSYPNPSVVKIQSHPVSTSAPATSDALIWNGTQWAPSPSSGLGTNYWTLNGSGHIYNNNTGGLVGIGNNAPLYKLDVLHGGGTGARISSSAGYSAVDIDATNGDAALRFYKAGVGLWNIRNRPADDFLEIYELNGGSSRFVIENTTGDVGIGETTDPTYKLDVLHGGSTGIRSRSSVGYSVVDIDAFNGDAALRFQKAAASQWLIRNNPSNDDLSFWEYGVGERMRIENTTGRVLVNGNFTVLGTKAFTMDHPLDPENMILVHAAAESNEVINFYSGNVITDANGKATVRLPDYFEAINKDFRYQLTVIGAFAQAIVSKEVSNNSFEISTNLPNIKVSWEVKGVRNDMRMKREPFVAEMEKPDSQKGKYLDPESHNQPQTKNVNYNEVTSEVSSLNHTPPVTVKTTSQETGGSIEKEMNPQTR